MTRLMERIPKDMMMLFECTENDVNSIVAGDLWDEDGIVCGGKNYGG